MPPSSGNRRKKIKAPARRHWYSVLLFIFGTLFPPLAIAARFGIGTDFFLNLLLTICGYIPGHAHNFYCQNIRNNQTKARTPKWAARYGLVDTKKLEAHQKRSQWAARYNERNPNSTLAGQQYEDGQVVGSSPDNLGEERRVPAPGEGETNLWNPSEESFYAEERASALEGGSGRWHYPANFADALPPAESRRKKKAASAGGGGGGAKKDRWARTEDAYNEPAPGERRSSRRKASRPDTMRTSSSTTDIPEDAEGGLFGGSSRAAQPAAFDSTPNFESREQERSRTPPARRPTNGGERDEFSHQF